MSQPPTIDGVELVPLQPGRNLAPRAFTSQSIFDLEQRAIFARSWVHIADLCDLPGRGDYVTGMIGHTPVMALRDPVTGDLRAFVNACRHRGAQLLEGKGKCERQIKCPYHAWSYGLDGTLHGVPFRDEFTCDLSQMNLLPVRVGSVGPLIMACLDPAAPDLETWMGELPSAFAAAGVDQWRLAWELTYDIDANWKLFVENANDGYHVQFVHDLLTDLLLRDDIQTTLEPHGAFTRTLVNPTYVPPGFDPATTRIRFGSIFPNLIPVLSPSDMTYLRVDPISRDRLRLFVRSYDSEQFLHLREFRKAAFQRTTDQDIAVVQRTFRGLHAAGLPAGVHASRLEARIGHFERLWAEAMARGAEIESPLG